MKDERLAFIPAHLDYDQSMFWVNADAFIMATKEREESVSISDYAETPRALLVVYSNQEQDVSGSEQVGFSETLESGYIRRYYRLRWKQDRPEESVIRINDAVIQLTDISNDFTRVRLTFDETRQRRNNSDQWN